MVGARIRRRGSLSVLAFRCLAQYTVVAQLTREAPPRALVQFNDALAVLLAGILLYPILCICGLLGQIDEADSFLRWTLITSTRISSLVCSEGARQIRDAAGGLGCVAVAENRLLTSGFGWIAIEGVPS